MISCALRAIDPAFPTGDPTGRGGEGDGCAASPPIYLLHQRFTRSRTSSTAKDLCQFELECAPAGHASPLSAAPGPGPPPLRLPTRRLFETRRGCIPRLGPRAPAARCGRRRLAGGCLGSLLSVPPTRRTAKHRTDRLGSARGPLPIDPTVKARLALALSRRRRSIKTGVSRHEPLLDRGYSP
jgi:hypothetical protein